MGALFLLVIIAYLAVALVIIVKAKGWKLKVAWLVGFALLPTFDAIAAQIYMHYRCAEDGGVRVYEAVTLKSNELTKMKIADAMKSGSLGRQIAVGDLRCDRDSCWTLPEKYAFIERGEDLFFGVAKSYSAYTEHVSGKVLGERIIYAHKSSWLIGLFFGKEAFGWKCPASQEASVAAFDDSVFKVGQYTK